MSDDLIRRSDAIKAVNKAKAEGMTECPTYYLGIVPTIEPKRGEWIPCSERLPEPEEIVLVTTIGMYPWAPNEKKVVVSVMYGTEEHYIWGIPQSYVTVIAWMPLPEPYKESE